jgi:putative transposase
MDERLRFVARLLDGGTMTEARQEFVRLSHLSAWWLRFGIAIERIKPGNPQQNGRHERMHLTLKKEAINPAAFNLLQQQSRFGDFVQQYNHDRPHQALSMKYPAEVYTPSPRVYRPPGDPECPFHDNLLSP